MAIPHHLTKVWSDFPLSYQTYLSLPLGATKKMGKLLRSALLFPSLCSVLLSRPCALTSAIFTSPPCLSLFCLSLAPCFIPSVSPLLLIRGFAVIFTVSALIWKRKCNPVRIIKGRDNGREKIVLSVCWCLSVSSRDTRVCIILKQYLTKDSVKRDRQIYICLHCSDA